MASSTAAMVEVRPQAGPLPPKVGEIGYPTTSISASSSSDDHFDPQPAQPTTAPTATTTAATSTTSLPTSTTPLRKQRILAFFKQTKRVYGIRSATLVRLIVLLCTVGATIAAWILIVQHLNDIAGPYSPFAPGSSNSTTTDVDPSSSNSTSVEPTDLQQAATMASTTFIFVHVAFAVALIFQLLFLERCVFTIRAERYLYLHPPAPGESPSYPTRAFAFAPWNRPPLPTYAAALGSRGTGDVEDNIIAQPPPPAYGNTRGSTLLLAGFIRDSLRTRIRADDAADPRDSLRSNLQRASTGPAMSNIATAGVSRHASARSTRSNGLDEDTRTDAERARYLELALARLEEGGSSPA